VQSRSIADLTLGFREPVLRLVGSARQAWLDTYVDQLVTRDAETLGSTRDPVLLRRYFEALCVNTAGLVEHKSIYDAASISRACSWSSSAKR
jgi:predicted AAA+ superfamily ATPase